MDKKGRAGILFLGLMVAGIGAMIIGFAIIGSDASDFPVGRWPAGLGGAVFLCAGLAILLGATPLRDVAGAILGSMIITSFAAILLMLCWRGARATGSVLCFPDSWNQAIARFLTGLFGLGLAALALFCWFHTFRGIWRLLTGRNPDGSASHPHQEDRGGD